MEDTKARERRATARRRIFEFGLASLIELLELAPEPGGPSVEDERDRSRGACDVLADSLAMMGTLVQGSRTLGQRLVSREIELGQRSWSSRQLPTTAYIQGLVQREHQEASARMRMMGWDSRRQGETRIEERFDVAQLREGFDEIRSSCR